MSSFLRIAGLIALLASIASCVSGKTVMQEINGSLLLLVGIVLLCVGEIIDRLDVIVRNSEQLRTATLPPPTPAPATTDYKQQSPAVPGSSRRKRTFMDRLLGRPGTGPYIS